jgi:hypothetical protein
MLVRCRPALDQTRWAITFDNYGSAPTFDRDGFGERFFMSRGVSVIVVLGRGNDWYQYPDMPDAIAAICDVVAGADRIMTYGSSMGGYAALRFADAMGAHACLALSPQYSNDPVKTPFEWRWGQEAATVNWLPEIDGELRSAISPVVMFDSRGADGRHAEMIARDITILPVALPYTGHPVTTYLGSVGLLEDAALSVLDGHFERAAFEREARARRRGSSVHVSELALRQPPHRRRTATALARHALALNPGSELMMHILAKTLTLQGSYVEALPLHAEAVRKSGGFLGYALPYSEALAAAGDVPAAMALAETMIEQEPGYAQLHSWIGHLFWITGRKAEALAAAKRARDMAPGNKHYRATLLLYRSPNAMVYQVALFGLRLLSSRKRR